MDREFEIANDNVLPASKLAKLLHELAPGIQLSERTKRIFDALAVCNGNPALRIVVCDQEGSAFPPEPVSSG